MSGVGSARWKAARGVARIAAAGLGRDGRFGCGRSGADRGAGRPGPARHPTGRGAAAALRRRLRQPVPRRADRRWSCSVTRPRPATACTARGRRPARCSPTGCPGGCNGRSAATASRWSARCRPACRHQVDAALERKPDLAVILIGGNDVTHRTPLHTAVRHLVDAVRALRAAGARVVVGTCPDLGAIQPIQPPLRWLARRWSRQLAAAQTVAVVEAGGRTVSLGDLLGPRVRRRAGPDVRRRPVPPVRRGLRASRRPRCCRPSSRRSAPPSEPAAALTRRRGRAVAAAGRAGGRAASPAPRSAAPRWPAATAARRGGGRSCAVARQRGSRPVRWAPGGCWERDAPARPYPWISPVPTRWRCRRNERSEAAE